MATFRRPLYSGSGHRLYNGDGLALSQEFEADSLDQAIFDLLTEVRAVLGGPGSTITQMLGASAEQQQQIAVYTRGAAALGVLASLVAPEVGIPVALGAEIVAIANELDLTGEVEAPADMPQNTITGFRDGTYPVTPVTPPPEGYGGGGGASAAEVWAYNVGAGFPSPTGQTATDLMAALQAAQALPMQALGVTDYRSPYFSVLASSYFSAYWTALLRTIPWPFDAAYVPDWSAWDGSESLVDFLNDHETTYPGQWTDVMAEAGQATGFAYVVNPNGVGVLLRCNVSEQLLPLVSGQLAGGVVSGGAPVWPGEDFATLGAPVAFDGPAEITAPMHGVLVDYTTLPQKVDMWQVSTFQNFGHAGQLAFVSDNGYAEPWQYLQWGKQVYVPRALSVAAACLIRPIAGQEGTVTPWTIS